MEATIVVSLPAKVLGVLILPFGLDAFFTEGVDGCTCSSPFDSAVSSACFGLDGGGLGGFVGLLDFIDREASVEPLTSEGNLVITRRSIQAKLKRMFTTYTRL